METFLVLLIGFCVGFITGATVVVLKT